MINLKPNDSLELITSSGADIDCVVSWIDDKNPGVDPSSSSTDLMTPDRTPTNITTATTTSICANPAASTVRNVKNIWIMNIDASLGNTITLQYNNNASIKKMAAFTLAAGEWAIINEAGVLFVYNVDGSVKAAGIASGLYMGEYLYTNSGNHTTGLYTHTIEFVLVGGGGGGAGVAANNNNMAASGGGSAGGTTRHRIAVSPGTAYAYVAGAGGSAAANNAAGGAGANSTLAVGANTWTAQGGAGGSNMANGATNLQTALGTQTPANTANSPTYSIGGQSGGQGWRVNGMVGQSGDGGCSSMGAGGCGVHSNINSQGQTVGQSGINYGGGGAGGLGTNGNANGGAGGNGCVIVREYT